MSRAALVATTILACLAVRTAAAQSVWELTPYRVQVLLASEQSPELPAEFDALLGGELSDRSDAVVGAPWELSVAPCPDPLRHTLLAGAETIALDALPPESLEGDKVMLLTIAPLVTGYEVTARELDVHTRRWSAPVRELAWQRAKLRDAAFRAMCRAFAPLTRIVDVDSQSKSATLRVRGGALVARDPQLADVFHGAPGELFLPLVRYNDREGNPRRIVSVPWTYLSVQSTAGANVECRIETGLRTPLSGRVRGRVERLALGVVAPHSSTQLVLQSRTDPKQVLAGYDVYNQAIDSPATEWLGRTDREGCLTVAPGGTLPRLLVIKHGGILLARLPVVPGLEPTLDAQVADDDQRLEAEGYVSGLQDELIDLVTRRQLLLVRARKKLSENDLDEANALTQQLLQLKTREQFGRELAQAKEKTVTRDKAVQQQIDAMFTQVHKLLAQYLDPKPVDDLVDQLARARQGGSS